MSSPHQSNHAFVHVYTGDGKGKTTAAVGLTVRAAGAGRRVFFAQFLKGRPAAELISLRRLNGQVTVRRFGGVDFVRDGGTASDADEAATGMAEAFAAVWSGRYSLIVLDEINLAVSMGLVNAADVLSLIDSLRPGTTLVLTGRYAPANLLAAADLVTEMVEVKHYYRQGVSAIEGIEA